MYFVLSQMAAGRNLFDFVAYLRANDDVMRGKSDTMVSMSNTVASAVISDAAFDNAVETLHDKVDVLLDRLTDSLLAVPTAGSRQWRNDFRVGQRVAGSVGHASVRAELARRAGIADPASIDRVDTPTGAASVRPKSRTRRRQRQDPGQLSIFDLVS